MMRNQPTPKAIRINPLFTILFVLVGTAAGVMALSSWETTPHFALAPTEIAQITAPTSNMISTHPGRRPNIIFIRTDDQRLSDMDVIQPNGKPLFQYVNKLLVQQGTVFTHNYTPLSFCCPSRASTLTGEYSHNNHVYSNQLPDGGYYSLDHTNTLPIWLQNAGYYTVHLGKYLNEYQFSAGIPPGWNEWYTSKDSKYFNYQLNENGTIVSYGAQDADYYTDVMGQKTVDFITQHRSGDHPFYIQLDFIAPHSTSPPQIPLGGNPVPAPRHMGIFANYTPIQAPSYNETDVSDKPQNVRNLPLIQPSEAQMMVTHQRYRLETLLSVDEQVRNIVRALAQAGELDNTYIVFTSDNGYQFGEHRIQDGKAQLYEESSRVPLVIRGPGILAGQTRNEVVANFDLTPTFLQWASAQPGLVQDGHSLVPLLKNQNVNWRKNILLENFGISPYKAVLNASYLYAEYDYNADGIVDEKELYNFVPDACRPTADPYEMESQHANPCYAALINRLHATLTTLKTCVGTTCG